MNVVVVVFFSGGPTTAVPTTTPVGSGSPVYFVVLPLVVMVLVAGYSLKHCKYNLNFIVLSQLLMYSSYYE